MPWDGYLIKIFDGATQTWKETGIRELARQRAGTGEIWTHEATFKFDTDGSACMQKIIASGIAAATKPIASEIPGIPPVPFAALLRLALPFETKVTQLQQIECIESIRQNSEN